MKGILKHRKKLILLFPLGLLIYFLASKNPSIVENYYSRRLYKFIGQFISSITGILPFSLAEVIVVCITVLTIFFLIKGIVAVIKGRIKPLNLIKDSLLNIFALFSIVYFLFILLWGINYHRQPLSRSLGLEIRPSSLEELHSLSRSLVDRANALRTSLPEDENGVMKLSMSDTKIFKSLSKGYINASVKYSIFSGKFGRPKGVFLSNLMAYTGITGVYFPFTGEANVNHIIPDFYIPSTAAHEMAHQRGFAREDEANYIAYLICTMHPDKEIQYSGVMLALSYTMSALYNYDTQMYKDLIVTYSPDVLRDLKFNSNFWKRYEGPIDRISSNINDAYLKSNLQEDGVNSYGRMVDLLLAEQREEKEKGAR